MKKYNLIENTSRKYYNQSEWINNDGLKFIIVGKTDRKYKQDYPYYLCKFEDNTLVEVRYMHISDGQVKNPNYPSVCGIGYLGEGKWSSSENNKRTKEYSLWLGIINRCYNIKSKDYKNYGARGVTLDLPWHNFQIFCNDIQYLDGYNEWKIENYELDKDILCEKFNIEPKIYSKKTCIFISKTINSIHSNLTGSIYIAHRILDNYEEEFTNQSCFAEKYNLQQQNINNCIRNKAKQHKGWTFKIKEKEGECKV